MYIHILCDNNHYKDGEISMLDLRMITKISYDYAKRHLVMIDRLDGDVLYVKSVKMNDDTNRYLSTIFQKKIKPIEYDEDRLLEEIEDIYGRFVFKNGKEDTFLEEILMMASSMRVSDIHIEPYDDEVKIRFRIDGVLYTKFIIDKDSYLSIITRIKFMSDMDISEKLKPQDGKMRIADKNNKNIDMRVSSIPQIWGEKIVIRILVRDNNLLDLGKVLYIEKQKKIMKKMIKLENGLIIVCGATGSGKSTTLYAMLREEDSNAKNIITIEDPVEYRMDNINQININNKAGLTFSNTIKYILRQDPDIIMVGEIRDNDTAESTVRAAITGHKVCTTLHTDSISKVYERLTDMQVNKYLIKDCLRGVISQVLVRRLCPYCCEEIEDYDDKYNIKKAYKSVGCDRCNDGYTGRIVLYEMMYISRSAREDFCKGNIKESDDYLNFRECLKYYVENGLISYEDFEKYYYFYED